MRSRSTPTFFRAGKKKDVVSAPIAVHVLSNSILLPNSSLGQKLFFVKFFTEWESLLTSYPPSAVEVFE